MFGKRLMETDRRCDRNSHLKSFLSNKKAETKRIFADGFFERIPLQFDVTGDCLETARMRLPFWVGDTVSYRVGWADDSRSRTARRP